MMRNGRRRPPRRARHQLPNRRRAGNHCSPYAHNAAGSYEDGLVRVSPGPFNSEAVIEALVGALREIAGE